MKFYKEKRKSDEFIESVIKTSQDGIRESLLYYACTKRFYVSTKAIRDRIKLLLDIGKIKREGDVLKWNLKTMNKK